MPRLKTTLERGRGWQARRRPCEAVAEGKYECHIHPLPYETTHTSTGRGSKPLKLLFPLYNVDGSRDRPKPIRISVEI